MQWHSHSLKKPSSYFLEPPPVPPEITEPAPPAPQVTLPAPIDVKPVLPPQQMNQMPPFPMLAVNPEEMQMQMKRETLTPSEILNSPRAAAKQTKPKQTRKRRAQNKNSPGSDQSTPPVRPMPNMSPFADNTVYGQQPTNPPPNWYPGPQSQGPMNPNIGVQGAPLPPQQSYYNPSPNMQVRQNTPPAPRYERNPAPGKAALNNMLRAKTQPQTQPYPTPQPQNQMPAGPSHPPAMFQQRNMTSPSRSVRPAAPQMMMQQQQNQNMYQMPNQAAAQHHMPVHNAAGYAPHPQQQQQQMPAYQNQMAGGMMQSMDQSHSNMNPLVNQGVGQMMPQGQGMGPQQVMNQGYGPATQQPNQMMHMQQRPIMQQQQPQQQQAQIMQTQQQFMQR